MASAIVSVPVLLLALGLAPVASGCGAGPGRAVRNILLVSIDTLRADHLGCYGYFRDTSPVMDALAEESVFFELCLSPLAATLPAHTSLLTGTYPLEHGILANVKQGGRRFARSPALRSFAEFAAERGYRTAAFVSATPLKSETGIASGFSDFDQPPGRRRVAAATNERVFAWLEENGRQPFFLWVHYFDPHSPYPPLAKAGAFREDDMLEAYVARRRIPESVHRPNDKPLETRQATNGYDGEIRYVDGELGRLIDRLEKLGLWSDTALILLSDHGEGLGDHHMAGHGYVHREQVQVPLMMRIPGVKPRRISTPLSLVDVLPTFLGLLGERESWSGFLDQASGRDVLDRKYAPEPVFAQRSAREREDLAGPAHSLATGKWHYIREPERGDRLFEWSRDPFELRNVISDHPEIAADLESQLLERIARHEKRGRELGRGAALPDQELDPELLEELRSLGYAE